MFLRIITKCPPGPSPSLRKTSKGRRTNFFWHPVLPHKCGVPLGYGTPHLCGSEEFCRAPLTGSSDRSLLPLIALSVKRQFQANGQPSTRFFSQLEAMPVAVKLFEPRASVGQT